jgi:hypothetical protein
VDPARNVPHTAVGGDGGKLHPRYHRLEHCGHRSRLLAGCQQLGRRKQCLGEGRGRTISDIVANPVVIWEPQLTSLITSEVCLDPYRPDFTDK